MNTDNKPNFHVHIKLKGKYDKDYVEISFDVYAEDIEKGKLKTHEIIKNLLANETEYYIHRIVPIEYF